MSKVISLFVMLVVSQVSLASVYVYNCTSKEGKNILKAGQSESLYVKFDGKVMAINNGGRIWNYLNLTAKIKGYDIYASIPPENFLQSDDLEAFVGEGIVEGKAYGELNLFSNSKAQRQNYNCDLAK
jgi:hypothetical protein